MTENALSFSNQSGPKLVLAPDFSSAEDFLKDCALLSPTPLFDVSKATLESLLLSAFLSLPCAEGVRLIGAGEAELALHFFLKTKLGSPGGIYGFIPDACFSLSTSKMVYSSLSIARMGRLNPDKAAFFPYRKMISDFEEYLLSAGLMDMPLAYQKTIASLSLTSPEDLALLFGFGEKRRIGLFPGYRDWLSGVEKTFLSLLECAYGESVELTLPSTSEPYQTKKVAAYGYSSEVMHVIESIRNEGLYPEEVEVLYTDTAYENMLNGLLTVHGIPYVFDGGESASGSDAIALILGILSFYAEHYSIEALAAIYRNPLMKRYECLNQLELFRSDKEQIRVTLEKRRKRFTSEASAFLKTLLSIDCERCSASELLSALLHLFTEFDLAIEESLFHDLERIAEELRVIPKDAPLTFNENRGFIESALGSLKVHDAKNKPYISVRLSRLSSARYLRRKHCFILGLSGRQLEAKEVDAPLFGDEERTKYLNPEDYFPLSHQQNADALKRLKALLSTKRGGEICFLRSSYDSVEFKLLAPSSFFNGLPGKETTVRYYATGLDHRPHFSQGGFALLLSPEETKEAGEMLFCPTSLETLVTCPFAYIYDKVIGSVETCTYDGTWLPANTFGTFVHLLCERYLSAVKSKIKGVLQGKTFDSIYEEEKKRLIEDNPFDHPEKVEAECRRGRNMALDLLGRYFKDNSPYLFLGAEVRFGPDPGQVPVSIDLPSTGVSIACKGSIDRIDGYVDLGEEAERVLHLRLIDYKTGSKDRLGEKVTHGTATQAAIYPYAALAFASSKEGRAIIEPIAGPYDRVVGIEHMEFRYEARDGTKEVPWDKRLVQFDAIDNAINRYRKLLNDPSLATFLKEYEPEFDKSEDHKEGRCSYCPFGATCRVKLEFGDNKAWQW